MRILHIIPSMASSYGGPSIFLAALQTELKKQGSDSTVITTIDPSEGNLTAEGKDIFYFKRESPRFYYFSRQLSRWLKENVAFFDVVHIHSSFSYPSTMGAYYSRREGVPFILRPFGTLDPEGLRHHPIRKFLYFSLIEKKNLEAASYVHCTSFSEAENIRQLTGKARCEVIPLGISAENEAAREPFPFPERFSGKKKILFLSRLHPRKGLEFLLDVIKELSLERRDFVLVLAGSGNSHYVKKVRRKINACGLEDFVFETGEVEGGRKASLLGHSDIFVLPSKRESFGIAAVEALFFALPVILSEGVAIHKDLSSSGAGISLPFERSQWVNSLNSLLNDEKERKALGMRGAGLARKTYALDRCANQLIDLYHAVVRRNAGNPIRHEK